MKSGKSSRLGSERAWSNLLLILCALVAQVLTSNHAVGQDVPAALQAVEQARIDAIASASRAAVCVFGPGSRGGGSGVVISPDGYALTNYHVVQSCDPFMKCSMNDGELYDAVIVGIDPTGDVALIKLLGRDDFPFATMADSDQVRQGDFCFAVGNPFLLATNFEPSVSWGIVSGVHRYQYPAGTLLEYADCIQTDAAINPGNSGGALFNSRGELIGINGRGSFEKRGRVNVGVGYAISINQIKYFMDHLKSGRIVDHATMGATVATDSAGAVRVSGILESSQAFRRGLNYDDEIVRFAGRDIQTVNQFKNVLGIFPKGYRVPIVYRRDGVEREITVRLTGVHAAEELIELMEGAKVAETLPAEPEPGDTPGKPDEDQQQQDDSKQAEPRENPARPPNLDTETRTDSAPPAYRDLFVKRSGFANYHFNLENRSRVWQRWVAMGDFTGQSDAWRLTCGEAQNQTDETLTLVLGDEKSGLQQSDRSLVLDASRDLSSQFDEGELAPLLAALHLWRKLMVESPERFGEVYYLGSVPFPLPTLGTDASRSIRSDVLVATRGAIECNFMFAKSDGKLVAMEAYGEFDAEPCQVWWSDYQIDGRLIVPGTIHFRLPNGKSGSLSVQQIEFLASKPSKE